MHSIQYQFHTIGFFNAACTMVVDDLDPPVLCRWPTPLFRLGQCLAHGHPIGGVALHQALFKLANGFWIYRVTSTYGPQVIND